MSRIMIFVVLLVPAFAFASGTQKVCPIDKAERGIEKISKSISQNNCQKGDLLYIRGTLKIMRTAVHVCDMETIKIQQAAVICEYIGEVRKEREK
jgi:hypothetical protein